MKQSVPYLDLSQEFSELKDDWLSSIETTGQTGAFILGPNVQAYEKEFADYIGAEQAVSVANGTDALELSLLALELGPGDEVITTPWTFFATAEMITMVGATPVFVDIDRSTFNLNLEQVARSVGPKTKAIMPVHIFGCPVDMHALKAIADANGLAIIEDCAQATGADIKGRRVGSFGDTGCFSFYPTKVLGCYGDGGMITVRDASLADKLRKLRNHGASAPFMHDSIGTNSRLDEIQASLLRLKLPRLEAAIASRIDIAEQYDAQLNGNNVVVPARDYNNRHVFNLYTIKVDNRDQLRQRLNDNKIGSSVCYPIPLHLQEVYTSLGYKPGDLPVSEQLANEVISLPVFPGMTAEQVDRVCEVVLDR